MAGFKIGASGLRVLLICIGFKQNSAYQHQQPRLRVLLICIGFKH